MKIVCLVKQVPRPDAIEFDPDTRTLRREGVAVGVPGDFEHLSGIVKSAVVVAVSCGAELEERADIVFRGDPDEVIRPLADLR